MGIHLDTFFHQFIIFMLVGLSFDQINIVKVCIGLGESPWKCFCHFGVKMTFFKINKMGYYIFN